MKYLKKFNENNSKLEELKSKIDKLSHRELAKIWRFGSSDNELLQGEAGKYFKDRLFNHFGGFNPSLSKGIGWDKNEAFSFLKRKKNDNDDSWHSPQIPKNFKDVLIKNGWFGIGCDEDGHIIGNHPDKGYGNLISPEYIDELLKKEENK